VSKRAPGSDAHGLIREEVVVPVKIPAGVEEGMQLNISGMGNDAPAGGVPGDLLVVIEEESHPELKRDGVHLHHEAFISIVDAALGGTVEVPLIDGAAKVKIEPGTQSNKMVRLPRQGPAPRARPRHRRPLRAPDGVDTHRPHAQRARALGEASQGSRRAAQAHRQGPRLLRTGKGDVRVVGVPDPGDISGLHLAKPLA
jgi:hypothetical protein